MDLNKDRPNTILDQAPTEVVQSMTPFLSEVYSGNNIINWKLIFPNSLSVTDTALPLAVVRLSPLNIFNGIAGDGLLRKLALLFSPVQFLDNVVRDKSNFKITSFNNPIAYQNLLLSHQYVCGAPNVSVRLTSNTGISGNLVYTVANNIPRIYDWDDAANKYPGYKSDADLRLQSHAIKSFAINDVSLVRHGINEVPHRDHGPFIDIPHVINNANNKNVGGLNPIQPFAAWYTEDVMLIYALSDIISSQTAPIILDFIFDFSPIIFETPIYPTWFRFSDNYYTAVDLNQWYVKKAKELKGKEQSEIDDLAQNLISIQIP